MERSFISNVDVKMGSDNLGGWGVGKKEGKIKKKKKEKSLSYYLLSLKNLHYTALG